MDFALKRNLRGAMLWSIETDDFLGISGDKYPILKTVNYALSQDASANEVPTDETPAEKPPSADASCLPSFSSVLLVLISLFTYHFTFY